MREEPKSLGQLLRKFPYQREAKCADVSVDMRQCLLFLSAILLGSGKRQMEVKRRFEARAVRICV
jgi:hypothetical protein